MSAAGHRVEELWLNATDETVDAAWEEAMRLAPQLEPNEADYLEALATKREVLHRMREDSSPPR